MSRQYRFDLVCPVCNRQSEITWSKRDPAPADCMVCCSRCHKERDTLVRMKVLRGEVLDGFEDPKVRWLRRQRPEPPRLEQLWYCPACGTENSEDGNPWRCAACFYLHPSLGP